METLRTVAALQAQSRAWRRAGKRVALVPTMGNLHAGHLSLVQAAQRAADVTIVSVFVNPTQFGPGEDFDRYPRTLEADTRLLQAAGVNVLFAPTVEQMYPLGANQTWVEVEQLGRYLCGASRAGHFRGMTTVVNKLFQAALPDIAVFGEKDFQQLTIVRRMAAELLMPVQVLGAPTCREADGLALSSRNGFLTATERQRAPALQQQLQVLHAAIAAGARDYRTQEARARAALTAAGFRVDYVSVASALTLAPAQAPDRQLVIAAAAWLGQPRLIDNVTLTLAD